MKYCILSGCIIIASSILIAADAINMSGQSYVFGIKLNIFALIVLFIGVILGFVGLNDSDN